MKAEEMVEKLKEIVKSSSEDEIYKVLVDCQMDPHEAVVRLTSLDTFQKVKSKRERRKEVKEAQESRSRGSSISTNHKFNSYDSEKQEYMRENWSVSPMRASSSTSHPTGRVENELPPTNSRNSENAETRSQPIGTGNAIPITAATQPPLGFRSGCLGAPGQATMADVVRMGKPQNKTTSPPDNGWTEVAYSENLSSGSSILDELPNTSDDAVWQLCEPHEEVPVDSTFSYHCEPIDNNGSAALSVAEHMQQLSLGKEKHEISHSALVIPSHLQVQPSEFSHLNFGTFRPIINSSSLVSGGATFDSENREVSSSSQAQMRYWDVIEEAGQSCQYNPSSVYENSYQLFNSAQKTTLHPYTNGMHSYSNPISSDMLASNGHSYPSFARQSMYNSAVSPTNIRVAEVLDECSLSPAQLASQCLQRNNSMSSGHTYRDMRGIHPHPETALPLDHLSRMVGYGSPHPNHPHMLPEAAYQQSYLTRTSLNQSASPYAAMEHAHPQYRNSMGYDIRGSSNAPVSFSQNGIGYDDTVLKENYFLPYLQNEGSDMDGHEQRVREKALEEFFRSYRRKQQLKKQQEELRQLARFQQAQDQQQQQGCLGYPKLYPS